MVGEGGEGRRREGRSGRGNSIEIAPVPKIYIWIDAAVYMWPRVTVHGHNLKKSSHAKSTMTNISLFEL